MWKEKSIGQRGVTATALEAGAAVVVVFFASPISQATRLYQPASLYFLDGLPPWGFLASFTLSLMLAFAVVVVLCYTATRAGVPPHIVERVLAAAVIFGAAFQLGSRSAIALFVGAPLALVAVTVCAYRTRLGEIACAILWRLCRILSLGCLAFLAYSVIAAVISFKRPPTPRFTAVTPNARAIMVLLFDEFDQELAFRLRPQRIRIPNLTEFESQALHATRVTPIAGMTTLAIPSPDRTPAASSRTAVSASAGIVFGRQNANNLECSKHRLCKIEGIGDQ